MERTALPVGLTHHLKMFIRAMDTMHTVRGPSALSSVSRLRSGNDGVHGGCQQHATSVQPPATPCSICRPPHHNQRTPLATITHCCDPHLYLPAAHLKASSRKMKLMPITLEVLGGSEGKPGGRRQGVLMRLRRAGLALRFPWIPNAAVGLVAAHAAGQSAGQTPLPGCCHGALHSSGCPTHGLTTPASCAQGWVRATGSSVSTVHALCLCCRLQPESGACCKAASAAQQAAQLHANQGHGHLANHAART